MLICTYAFPMPGKTLRESKRQRQKSQQGDSKPAGRVREKIFLRQKLSKRLVQDQPSKSEKRGEILPRKAWGKGIYRRCFTTSLCSSVF